MSPSDQHFDLSRDIFPVGFRLTFCMRFYPSAVQLHPLSCILHAFITAVFGEEKSKTFMKFLMM
jgi:hypothetical protein